MTDNTTGRIAGRVTSIDALRGFDMFWIMGGDSFFRALFVLIGTPFFVEVLRPELEHSTWDGFTFYDLIFPLFLFIVGLTMPLSITRRLEKGHSRQRLYYHIAKPLYFLCWASSTTGSLILTLPTNAGWAYFSGSQFVISLRPSL